MKKKRIKKILVIGGTGFIGHHLLKKTVELGWKSFSISRKAPKKNRFIKKVKYLHQNVKNIKKLNSKLKKDYDYIINTSHIEIGTLSFLLKRNYRKFLHIGSSAEYGNLKTLPLHENLACKPTSYYGKKKFKFTNNLIKKFKSNFFPLIVVRLFQIYGPNDDTNKLIPYVIKNCLKNKNFNLTNGYQTRDFCHINDIVRAVIMLLKSDNKKIYGNIFNISSGKSVTVKNLVNKIKKKVGLGKPNFGSKKIKKNEIIFSHASIKKIKKFIGWSPKISLNNGVKNLISYEK